jgi:hypothetical protein
VEIRRVRDEERLICRPKRKYFEVDALIDFEPMERFENRRDVTESRSRDCSAGNDCFGFSHFFGGERVEFEEGHSREGVT